RGHQGGHPRSRDNRILCRERELEEFRNEWRREIAEYRQGARPRSPSERHQARSRDHRNPREERRREIADTDGLRDGNHADRVKAVSAIRWDTSKNFTGGNFHYWLKAIRNHLKAARLWDLVTGVERRLRDGRARDTWNHLNRVAVVLLMSSVQDDLLLGITGEETAVKIWEFIGAMYHVVKWGTSANLLSTLTNLKMTNGANVNDHLTQFQETAERLNEMGDGLNAKQLTALLLGSLPETWNTFKTTFWIRRMHPRTTAWKPTSALKELVAVVNLRLDARTIDGKQMPPTGTTRQRCKCIVTCMPASKQLKPTLPESTSGHKATRALLIHTPMTLKKHTTELEQIKAKSKGSEANSVDTGVDEDPCDSDLTTDNKWSWAGAVWGFLEANAHQADTVHDDNHGNELEWVVDSGATHHMCFVKSMFVDLVAPNASTITTVSLPNGGKGDVEGI
ncbi:hypothetical protein As57867_007037, partial [Aphanomyces stellatus]